MKKFLFATMMLLSFMSAATFTSCSKDDDDDEKSANVAVSLNGEAIDNNGSYTLAKGTVLQSEGTEGTDDVVSLSITSTDNKNITSVQIKVNNDFEKDVDVVDIYDEDLNSNFKFSAPSTEKTVKFVGVYGTYTVKVVTEDNRSKTYKFTLNNKSGHLAYGESSNRYLCNKQTIYFDSDKTLYANSIIGLTYNVEVKAGQAVKNFGKAKIYAIDKDIYNNLQGAKGDFYIKAETYGYDTVDNINEIEYLVYKNNKTYYLIHITEIDNNILKADIQY